MPESIVVGVAELLKQQEKIIDKIPKLKND